MPRESEKIEKKILEDIIRGVYPAGGSLPGERELALRFGVTRPTVRSALQRLARDGWIAINERRTTTVNDYWAEGNLNVLSAMAGHTASIVSSFVKDLLEVRLAVAPDYAARAVQVNHMMVVAALARPYDQDDALSTCDFDWQTHISLARLSGNRIYPLMLNSFTSLYRKAGAVYFAREECRGASVQFYRLLLEAAVQRDRRAAYDCTKSAMQESLQFWEKLAGEDNDSGGGELI